MKGSRILILVAIVAAVGAFFALDLGRYLSLDFVKSQQAAISTYAAQNPFAAAAAFFAVYVAVTGLSLPGAAILTLVGGAVFGLGIEEEDIRMSATFAQRW